MGRRFAVPREEPKRSATIETFRGIDLNNSPPNVDMSRSPSAPNMVRDQVGKVRKRMGYRTITTAAGRINGFHRMGDKTLIHAGTKLCLWNQVEGPEDPGTFQEIGTMADARSRSFVFDKKLYLLDGTTYQVYDGETLKPVSENAYVPTIIISRNPAGGGTTYEALNLIGTKWKESFLSDGKTKVYQLTTKDLTAVAEVETQNKDGEWTVLPADKYTVNLAKGTVTFKQAPAAPPVVGQDNVRITASKAREGYADKVNKCTVFATYGVGGAADRVFLSGNPDQKGQDLYSGFDDPTFFPDTSYTNLGRDGSEVINYAILNNNLATFLSGSTDGRNVIVRTGMLDEKGEAVFRITNTLLGEAPVAKDSFCLSGKEPLFLTDRGVYAITAEDLTGEKYSQERSYYIKSALQELQQPGKCSACIYRDFYVLAADGDIYLLDLQQRAYERDSPYSSFQYECYFWPGIGADLVWEDDGALWFGTETGKIVRFHTEVDAQRSYNDDGAAIDAYWETPDFDDQKFFHVKTFVSVSIRLASAVRTGVRIYAQKRGVWALVFNARSRAKYLDFRFVDFSQFTFSTDRTPRTMVSKIKVKKVDKTRFRLRNAELNEPFGVYAFGTEWKEPGGNYKR